MSGYSTDLPDDAGAPPAGADGADGAAGARDPVADVRLVLNQLELPDDFEDSDLEEVRAGTSAPEARTEVVVAPEGAPRDPLVLATLFVIHFVTVHGADIALAVGEGAIWDGIKSAFRRLRRRERGATELTRVGVTYPDGTTLFVEVHSDEELVRAVRALRPASSAG